MTRRRLAWMAATWVVTTGVATTWVVSQTDGEVSLGNAVMVGVVAGTAVSAGVASVRRS